MTMDAAVHLSAEQWVERARTMAPLVERYRDQAEEQRHLPPELVEPMRERGLFSLWLPRSLGGPELPIETAILVMEELSRQDGSVGWNSMISTNHSILWSHIPRETAAAMVDGGAKSVIAGTIGGGGDRNAPGGGVATKVPGGFRITGKWAFASGCHHADWMVANGRISENGELRKTPQGNVGLYSFLLSPSEVKLLDTWYTTGMRGTGSHHFEATDVFVPEDRMFPTASPPTYEPSPLYSTARSTPWSGPIAGVCIGIARDAIDSFLELAKVKPASMGRSSLLERDSVHRAVGEAEGRLQAARAFLLETARRIDGCIARGEPIPDDAAAQMRCATATASLLSTEAVDLMYTTAGASSIYATNRLDRCFRDVHTTISHAVGGIGGLPVAGRYYLGLGINQGM
jgi:alkylation response protein AidB-like acyl-CoA dehydrogenase